MSWEPLRPPCLGRRAWSPGKDGSTSLYLGQARHSLAVYVPIISPRAAN